MRATLTKAEPEATVPNGTVNRRTTRPLLAAVNRCDAILEGLGPDDVRRALWTLFDIYEVASPPVPMRPWHVGDPFAPTEATP